MIRFIVFDRFTGEVVSKNVASEDILEHYNSTATFGTLVVGREISESDYDSALNKTVNLDERKLQ